MEDQTQLTLENLPDGLSFNPPDEILLTHYLMPKLLNQPISGFQIEVLELSKYDPWDLLAKFKKRSGDDEVHFFCRCEYNKRTGNRIRKAGGGHWKSTGNPRPVRAGDGDYEIGVKRSLVFHNPAATQFVITEYAYTAQLGSNIMEDFVLCKLRKRLPKNMKKVKKARQRCKPETRPNKKARKVGPSDVNTDPGSTLTYGNQNLNEMTAYSTYTPSEESNYMASFVEHQHLDKTTTEATNPESTEDLCKRIDTSSYYTDEPSNSIAMQMTVTLLCSNGNKEDRVSQDFGNQDPANSTDISASYETFDFGKQNQNTETDMSTPINYWSSLLDSTEDPEFQGAQIGEIETPVLEDNQVSTITSSDVGDTTVPKNIDVQKWLEEFLEL